MLATELLDRDPRVGLPQEGGDDEPQSLSEGGYGLDWALDDSTFVWFSGHQPDQLQAVLICEFEGYATLLGVGRFASEQQVLDRLGPPSGVSISRDGLSKTVTYQPYHIAFELTKGAVSKVCVTKQEKVKYRDEYEKP